MTSQLIFDMDDTELGYYFYQQRKKKKLNIPQLSKIAGVSRSTISLFENGKLSSISLTNVRKLSEALCLELKYCLLK